MSPRDPDAINESGMDIRRSMQAYAIVQSNDLDTASVSELIASIEQAISASDALGLVFVSIDLCSALSRLQAITTYADPAAATHHV